MYIMLTARILGFDLPMLTDLAMQLFNTLVLAGALSFLLYKPVIKFMKTRADRIRGEIESAETEAKQAHELKVMYEEKLKAIEKERQSILDDARKRGLEKESQILAEAKEEADLIKNRAMLDIDREQQKAKDEMKTQMIEISTLIASRFISAKIDETTGSKLLDDVIADLGDAKWLN